MVTAYGREEVLRGAESVGMEDVLIKPVSASVLFDNVARLLGGGVAAEARKHVDSESTGTESLRGARVLLVEDNELNQEVASELLRDAGFIVDIADDGQLALDALDRASFDIVLMDMQMPVMDGLEATRRIRAQERFAKLPVVAMTANAMEEDRRRCLEVGMNDHLGKPIEPTELWAMLLKWIPARAPAAGEAVVAAAKSPPEILLPEGIPGLDVDTGLRRVLGKRALYLSMLQKFVAGQRDTIAQLRSTLASGEVGTTERIAHTTKGVAGNIGASEVQAAAESVERALREQRSDSEVSLRIDALAPPLSQLLAALSAALGSAGTAAASAGFDAARFAGVRERLLALHAEDDAEAGELLLENAELLQAALPAQFHKIDQAVRSFDFQGAHELLSQANPTQAEETQT
jgi:CheY-like chemotaxis protein